MLDAQGTLRVDSRISHFSHLNLSNKPIILYERNETTILLINHYHKKFFYGSHETVLNELRRKYWIVGLRLTLKRIVSKFTICKFLRGKPHQPRMAPLP